ncbi:cation-transporting P-type ATPase [Aureimonas sp. SA4125]|uniref:cation-transporting P-type ATPase n=1 Tax=Aureimonas sp. SA4125 TaxID=2826993 RepID=UPI001CC4B4A6|nr:cation-transporting P-type ATPase [Aureimonas sp. SA4125]
MHNLIEADLSEASPVFRDPRFHARGSDEVLQAVGSRLAGLTAAEAAARLETHGPNKLPDAARVHPVLRC